MCTRKRKVKKELSAWESNPARARVVLIVDIMTSANVTNTPAKMLRDDDMLMRNLLEHIPASHVCGLFPLTFVGGRSLFTVEC